MPIYVYITDNAGDGEYCVGYDYDQPAAKGRKVPGLPGAFQDIAKLKEVHDEASETFKLAVGKEIVYLRNNDNTVVGDHLDYAAKHRALCRRPNVIYITSEVSYAQFKAGWDAAGLNGHEIKDGNAVLAAEREEPVDDISHFSKPNNSPQTASKRKAVLKRIGLFFLHPGNYALIMLLALVAACLIQAGLAGSVVAAIATATAAFSMTLLTGIIFLAVYKFAKNPQVRAYFDDIAPPSLLQKIFRGLGTLGVIAALALGIGYLVAPQAAFSFMAPVFTTMTAALTTGFSSMALAGGTMAGLASFMPVILPMAVILFALTPFIIAATLDRAASRSMDDGELKTKALHNADKPDDSIVDDRRGLTVDDVKTTVSNFFRPLLSMVSGSGKSEEAVKLLQKDDGPNQTL